MSFCGISHAIFDLDGTLVDTESLLYSAIDCLSETFALNTNSLDTKSKLLGHPLEERAKQLYSDLGFTPNVLSFNSFKSLLIENCVKNVEKNGIKLMPGVERVVTQLREHDIPMAIASGNDQNSFKGIKERFENFFQNFCFALLSGDKSSNIKAKPDPHIYLEALNRFSPPPLSPKSVLVFEDTEVGVESATRAHMNCVLVWDSRLHSKPEKPINNCLLINSFLEFNPKMFGIF